MRPRYLISPLLLVATLTAVPLASAQTEPPAGDELFEEASEPAQEQPTPQAFSDHLVFDTGRTPYNPPSPDAMRGQIHGEFQLRYQRQTDVPLTAPPQDLGATSLGQKNVLHHWLRLNARFDFRDKLFLFGQIDLPRGFIVGDKTRYVQAASEPLDEHDPVDVDPRWLYLEAHTSYGLWRLGQMGSNWGMGILANDGNTPSLFGDYRGGSIVERVLFATRPAGKSSPLTVVLAGDLVYSDRQAKLSEEDVALQAVAALAYGDEVNQLGLYGVVRQQSSDNESIDHLTVFTEELSVRVLDGYGKFATPIPGTRGWIYGQAEGAIIVGSTNYVRTPEQAVRGVDEQIRSYGGAARLGAVREATDGKLRWGDIVVGFEWGFASGDADPNDGVQHRFSFDPNYNVGLVLYDHVLAWSTARSAVAAGDPTLVNRAAPGLQFYASDGGVFGSMYLYPTMIIRPKHWLDLKAAALLAQTTADVVDPYHFGVLGQIANARGGDPKRHDLGLELDGAVEARVALEYDMTLQLGVQAGILFPGHALDDRFGNSLPNQVVAQGRLGLQY